VGVKVAIDGHAGTTGLQIRSWLAERRDLELLTLPDERRKDAGARREILAAADVAVLCLPDDAAREAAAWAEAAGTRVIDTSTAHRVAPGWVYGLAELAPAQRAAIAGAKRVSNPGCYPVGVVLLLRPLVEAGLLADAAPIAIHALSGYTGGGRTKIERWESPGGGLLSLPYEAPYALGRVHKHIPEIKHYARLAHEPQLVPAVGPFACGMRVQIPLHAELLTPGVTGKAIWEALQERYARETFVRVAPVADPLGEDERSFDPRACNDTNDVVLHVVPHPSGHVLLLAILDNLGKGASGSAIQCLNLMLGLEETAGLPLTR
jgi:N-acetyl-gamma-glutamyl-phosphate reductase